ncbi:MAG: hypothetical protein NZ518_06070, partial [Dehalococcoidia bacterium]|nr:hypothetical protein [Dehalococcoidia bacterium]
LAARFRRVWVARWQDDVVDPNGYLARLLAEGADREPLSVAPRGVALERYTFRPGAVFRAAPTIRAPLVVDYGGQIRLVGYDPPTDGGMRTPAGGALTVTYYWQAQKPLTADYKVALRLVDAQGAVWGRVDRRPAAYAYLTTRWRPGEIVYGDLPIPLSATTPPGTYRLEMEVYAEQGQTIVPLNVLNDVGAPIGQSAVVGELVVTAPVGPQRPVEPPRRLAASMGALALVGVDQPLSVATQRPGGAFEIGLYWTVPATPDGAADTVTFALRSGGQQQLIGEGHVAPSDYPIARWQPGAVWRGVYRLRVPVGMPAGVADLLVLPASGDPVVVGQVTVLEVDRGQRLPDVIANPLRTPVGGFGVLRGWEIDKAEARAGETVRVTLYWEAIGPAPQDLKVFVHLLDAAGRVVAQRDAPPRDGAAPTIAWTAGQTIIDPYPIVLPRDLPAGELTIEVGMYDPESNRRVLIGRDDHLVLGIIRSR